MKNVFIKYNPYKIETEITVDGRGLAQNSELAERAAEGCRLQEWVEDLPKILLEEYNDREFEIEFHGTLLDCEDLKAAFEGMSVSINHKPAKETSDKEALIDDVFVKIKNGPFHELRAADVINAFEHAKSSDFEVCVVATMSAGKSTLINAMLGKKLLPAKMEACTATITRIKDTPNDEQTEVPFRAEVYDKNGQLKEKQEHLTYEIMERLNSDENVSTIQVMGNIPFVSSEDTSLVLTDTPGPNNSRDPSHKRVQSELLGKSSKALVLYIMTGEFGTDDDNALLKRVAESMRVGGKQSKDRFIFVINKLDDRRKEDGDVQQTLDRIRSYLEAHGVTKPNLFPAAALPALNLRLIKAGSELDEDVVDETETKVKKLNRNNGLHFEAYVPLPPSVRDTISNQIELARAKWKSEGKPANENPDEALIHTGLVSIEAAIRQYVQKYAKTAKIKNIVDTFVHKLDEVGCFEEAKRELATHQEESKRIVKQIESMRKKMDDANDAKKFKDEVNAALVKLDHDFQKAVDGILRKYERRVSEEILACKGQEIEMESAIKAIDALKKFSRELEPEFRADLEELINGGIVNTSNFLLHGYKKKLSSLSKEIGGQGVEGIYIDPLKLMSGSVRLDQSLVDKLEKNERQIADGAEYVENTSKAWYKPWTWGDEEGYWRDKYKTVHCIKLSELAQAFFQPIQQSLHNNGDKACEHARTQAIKIAERFNIEFARLDNVLRVKLSELESYATDEKRAAERIKECERKLEWLNLIAVEVQAILEI